MNNDNLLGVINPTSAMLPSGFPSSTKSSSSKKSSNLKQEKEDDYHAMWYQKYKNEIYSSQAKKEKIDLTNQLYSIAKRKYGGDLSGFINDPDVNSIFASIRQQNALLSANRETLEMNYEKYKDAAKKIESDKSGNKYAVNDYGSRYFTDQKGVLRYEGMEGTKDQNSNYVIKRGGDYLKNNQLLEYAWNNTGYTQLGNGMYQANVADFGNSVDFSKDYVKSYYDALLEEAANKKTSVDGGLQVIKDPTTGALRVIGENAVSNNQNINNMLNAFNEYAPAAATAQLKQSFWERGYDRMEGIKISVPIEEGSEITKDIVVYPTDSYYKSIKEKEAAGKELTPEEKQIKEKNIASYDEKYNDYVRNVTEGYANSKRVYDRGDRILKGSGGEDLIGGALDKSNYLTSLALRTLKDPLADTEEVTFYHEVNPPEVDEDGDMIKPGVFEEQQFRMKIAWPKTEELDKAKERNIKLTNSLTDENGEYTQAKLEANGENPYTKAPRIVVNGFLIDPRQLDGAVTTSEDHKIYIRPKLKKDTRGNYALSTGTTTVDGKEVAELGVWRKGTMLVPPTEENLEKFKQYQFVEKDNENREGLRKDYVRTGTDIVKRNRPWTNLTLGGESLGFREVNVENEMEDYLEVEYFYEVGLDMDLTGGGTSKQYKQNAENDYMFVKDARGSLGGNSDAALQAALFMQYKDNENNNK